MRDVVKFGGSSLGDLCALASFLKSRGPTVVVHGGGPEIQRQLDKEALPSEFREGLRVTSPEAMSCVEMVLAGRVNKRVVAYLQRAGLPAVGVSGVDGATLKSQRYAQGAWGEVGVEVTVDTRLLLCLLEAGFLPVLSPVGFAAEDYAPLNVNADTAAAAVAAALRAERFTFFTDVEGIRDRHGSTLGQTDPEQIRELMALGVIQGGMIPKVEAAMKALRQGVSEVVVGRLGSSAPGTRIREVLA